MKKLISLLMVTILLIGIMPTVAFASESVLFLSEELNETQLSPNAPAAIETPEERHNRLIAEGYELVSSSKGRQTRASFITGPDGKSYETRYNSSYYRQPIKRKVRYGEDFANIIGNSFGSRIIDTGVGFIPKVGWIPSALGINATSVADFFSRGRISYELVETLYFYDIEAKLAGTNRWYFVASSERLEQSVTAVSSGFSELASPVQEVVQARVDSKSPNYGNFSSLSRIAVNYLATGGPNHTYVYFEHYPLINTINLS